MVEAVVGRLRAQARDAARRVSPERQGPGSALDRSPT